MGHGIGLIYVRSGLAFDQFTPKLWTKISIMTFMVFNAVAISRIVLPIMQSAAGKTLLALPGQKLALMTKIAVNSVFCLTAGLALGSSIVLKTATSDVITPVFLLGYTALTLGGHMVLWFIRESLGTNANIDRKHDSIYDIPQYEIDLSTAYGPDSNSRLSKSRPV